MILVTGGTGLVGAHLLYELTKNGEQVRAIYRNERKIKNTEHVFASYGGNHQELLNKIKWTKADLLDIPALTEAFKDITYIYHCAAFVSFEPDKYFDLRRINIEGTANIVNICIEKKIKKLCYVSSIATLGNSIKGEKITENTDWNPEEDNSVYGITKYGAEMEVWRGSQEGLDVIVINPGVILGAGIWRYGTGSFFKRAYKGIKYYPNGTIAIIAVEDVVSAMIQLTNSQIKNERFILVAENWSYKHFLEAISKSVNQEGPKRKASKYLLEIIWRLDWLANKLFGKRRKLTRHLIKSLQTNKEYSAEKIKATLNFSFEPMDKVIEDLGNQYLKQVQ